MKLNYRRTVLVGFAFMSISAFWYLYDQIIPLILKFDFAINDTIAGAIMALDNVFALIMLPLFGAWSDKVSTKIGKRMPFIIVGTLLASAFTVILPLTAEAKALGLFIAVLLLILVSMSVYRSPAVSLMPDVTPKPLRSKGNAVINLLGTVGGLVAIVLINFFLRVEYYVTCVNGHRVVEGIGTNTVKYICEACGNIEYSCLTSDVKISNLEHGGLFWMFVLCAVFMVGSVIVLFATIRENKLVSEREKYEAEHPSEGEEEETENAPRAKMPREVKRSLAFLLMAIAFLFMSYNAVTTAFSKYAIEVLGCENGEFSLSLMVAMVAATISFVPIGILSSKFGRKKVIIVGTAVMAAVLAFAVLINELNLLVNVLFAFIGIAWAAINVNTYPMVVEMSRGSDIGKYTGLYYTFSMAAQVATPVLSGALLEYVGYWTLFPYAAVFAALALVSMFFVKHGDVKPEAPRSALEAFDVED